MGTEAASKPAAKKSAIEVPLTSEDEELLDMQDKAYGDEAPLGEATEVPDWVVLPPDLKMPEGRQIYFMRFRANWTDRPDKGERQCIMWNLTEADEKIALRKTRGDSMRTIDELSKQMIRAIDGKKVDWSSVKPDEFWNEVGGACRQMLKNHYAKTHSLGAEETADFFANCIAVRTAKG